jgi:hypothetical protein
MVFRWKEEIDGLVLRGGDGIPGNWGVVTASIGVTEPEKGSLASATEGDCNGDCMGTCFVLAEASIIKGGRSGVVAKPSSRSPLPPLAFSMSIAAADEVSSGASKMLLVGVGGSWGSKVFSSTCRAEFEIDDDRLDAPREAAFSRCASAAIDAELGPFLNRHFRENEGNLVPSRVASPDNGDSTALRFR